jgi:importin subunit beta-1
VLLEVLVRGQTDEEDDSWNLSQASGVCLGLVANLVGDQCVDIVLDFVGKNFGNPDWRSREAAVLAFGSIMEGPTSGKMAPVVASSFASLANTMKDQNVAVRDTVAWTLGRIVQFHPSIVPIRELTPLLVQALSDQPRVADKVCWAIEEMADKCTPDSLIPGQAANTTPLSEFFAGLAEKLLDVTKRPDASERNLRNSAYNSLSTLIANSGNDCIPFLGKLVEEMLVHLNASFQVLDKECELQSLICGVLMNLALRLRQQIIPYADNIMEGALKVMQAYQQVKSGQVLHEEALLLVQTLASVMGSSFQRYMTTFAPHLQAGLTNFEDVKVCMFTISMVGTIAQCLEASMGQYCAAILQLLYGHLQNDKVDRRIKSAIMPVFGDIALQIGGEFEQYSGPVFAVLQDAANTRIPDEQRLNEDSVEYLHTLRVGVLEAYQGIINGLKGGGKLAAFKDHVNALLQFIYNCAMEGTNSEELMSATLKVLSDVIMAFERELVVALQSANFAPCIQSLLSAAANGSQSMKNDGSRLQSLLAKYG